MKLNLYKKFEPISNDNISGSSIINSNKKNIIKTQIINDKVHNERGYKEIMQKKNVFKNSFLSSHNNFKNFNYNNNILTTNEKDNKLDNKTNFQINSSINVSGIFINKKENKNKNNKSNINQESSDEYSEMSFGVVNVKNENKEKKEISKKKNDEEKNKNYNIHNKRIKNINNFIYSCSVDNKMGNISNNNIEIINKKLDKKNFKGYITPLKRKIDKDNIKTNKKSYEKNISHENDIKKFILNSKINNHINYNNNDKNKNINQKNESKSISKSKSKSKTKQINKNYSQLKTPLSYLKRNFKNKKEIYNINHFLNNNKNIEDKKKSSILNTYIHNSTSFNKLLLEQSNLGKNKFDIKRKHYNNHSNLNNSNNNTNNSIDISITNISINKNKFNINKNNKIKTNQYKRNQKIFNIQNLRTSIICSNENSFEKKKNKNYNNIIRKSLDINDLNSKKKNINNNEEIIDNKLNKEKKSINILPLNLNNYYINNNNKNLNNTILALKDKNNKSINKNSNNNSLTKKNKKNSVKTIIPDTKIIHNLDNSLIKSYEINNKEMLIKSYNFKNKINYSNFNSKNIIKNINKENNLLISNKYKNIENNKKISKKKYKANSLIKSSNLSDSSVSKKNKIYKSISAIEDTNSFRIPLLCDKKTKIITTEKENTNNEINKNVYDSNEENLNIKNGEILLNRYEVINNLGKGTFGNCIKCFDKENKENVCIKIIKNLNKYKEQTKEEIDLINYINTPNIIEENIFVQIKNTFIYNRHYCIVFELLSNNLYEEIQQNKFMGFNLSTIKKFAIQLLFGLLILKTKKIIHCDLKPENILLINKGKTKIKIIDFGSSCYTDKNYYLYIQSRFYRAPEIILELKYGVEIDMWSFGCILCELYSGLPIFPGENEYDVLYYIMEYIGVPPKDIIFKSPKRRYFFNDKGEPLEKPNSFGKIRRPNQKYLEKFLKNSDNDFIDLIKKIFKWKKEERITPDEALKHKWIIKNMNNNILSQHLIKIKNFSDFEYCSSLCLKDIKDFEFDDKSKESGYNFYNQNNNSEDEIGSFRLKNNNYENNNIDDSKNFYIDKDEDYEFNENIFNNNSNSPEFASKI